MAPSHRSCFVPRSCAFTIRWQFYCGRCKRTGWDLQPRSTFLRDRSVSGFGSKQPLPWSRARPGGWLHSREAVVKWPLRKQWSCFSSSRLCCTLPNQEFPLTFVQDTSIFSSDRISTGLQRNGTNFFAALAALYPPSSFTH